MVTFMSDRLIKVIIFDMGCTLFWEPACEKHNAEKIMKEQFEKLLKEAEKLGYEVPHIENAHKIYIDIREKIWKNSLERELWHKYLLLRFFYEIGIDIDLDDLEHLYWYFIDMIAKRFTLPRRHRQLLEYLSGTGYNIILTTATGAHDLPLKIIKYNDVKHFFNQIFSTQLLGLIKPDPRFYVEIAETLHVEPHRIIHIGDSLKYDVLPAMKAGYKTVLFDWRTKCRPGDNATCITDLWEVLEYIQ